MLDDELYQFLKETQERNRQDVRERSISVLKINLLILAGLVSLTAAVFGENNDILVSILSNYFTLAGISLSVMATGSSGLIYFLNYISHKNTREYILDQYKTGDYSSIEEVKRAEFKEYTDPTELASMATTCVVFTAFSVPFIAVGVLDTITGFQPLEVLTFLLLSLSGVAVIYVFVTELYSIISSLFGTARALWAESRRIWVDGISQRESFLKITLLRIFSLGILGINIYVMLLVLRSIMEVLSIYDTGLISFRLMESAIFLFILLSFVLIVSLISEYILSLYYTDEN
ncbi:hypothetical protein EXE43_08910 [Halorubrum sp. SS5]|nr:hypothetical protein EXE43_08910 [Halorubrum sp. SS5]